MARYHDIEAKEKADKERVEIYQKSLNVNKAFDKVFPQVIKSIFKKGEFADKTFESGHMSFRKIQTSITGLDKQEKDNCYNLLDFMHKEKMHKILEDRELIVGVLNIMKLNLFTYS